MIKTIETKKQFREWVLEAIKESNLLDTYVNTHKQGEATYLYGAGHAAEFYVRYFNSKRVRIDGIIDQDENKQGKVYYGVPVFSLEKVIEEERDADIVIAAPSVYREILLYLYEKGIPKERIFAFDVEQYAYYRNSSDKVKEYIMENIDGLWDTYQLWEDEKSRIVMLNVLRARLTENLDYIHDIWENNQYWPDDLIHFGDEEVIVECGSCDGKTIRDLLEKINHRFKKIYCFEPDKQCAKTLESIVEEEKENGEVVFIPKGTHSEEGILRFKAENVDTGLSYVDEEGEITIPVTTMFSFLAFISRSPDLPKRHIILSP